jgi:hypothetical protein
MKEQRQPWDVQEGETSKSYAAFAQYRDLPAEERSLSRVLSDLTTRAATQPEHSRRRPDLGQLKRWSMKHGWRKRVLQYDLYRDQLKREALEDEAVTAARRQADRSEVAQRATMLPVIRLMRDLGGENGVEVQQAREQELADMTAKELLGLTMMVRMLPALGAHQLEALGVQRGAQPAVSDAAYQAIDPVELRPPLEQLKHRGEVIAAMMRAGNHKGLESLQIDERFKVTPPPKPDEDEYAS